MATQFKSSITDGKARQFIEEAQDRETLFCRNLPGLYLIRLKTGGSWRFRYTDDAGKRRTATIGKFPAMKAETAAGRVGNWISVESDPLKEKADRRESARAEKIQRESRTLGKFLEGGYAKYQERRKTGKATLRLIRGNFEDWLEEDMASLTAADVLEWQERRESDGLAHKSIQRAYTALKTLLNEAARRNVIEANPLKLVRLEQEASGERTKELQERREAARRLLTDDELTRLHHGLSALSEEIRAQRRNSRAHGKPDLPDLDAVEYPHWFIPFCLTALYTGMRPGDLYSMTWQECSVDFGRIDKICEKTRHHEKPAKISMHMAPPLKEALKRWHVQHGKPKTGLVFPSPVSGEQMDRNAHRRAWVRVKELAGLPDELVFYALRHHFISALVAKGLPMLTVAKLAGQKSTAMIEEHYGHLCESSAADAISALAESVGPKDSTRIKLA